ncbi:unnamed protein product [Cylicocyclus nassatus]|uniref:Transthyretin-like family protein n=1 Tax=Cylicocyclus nassatus TaxID=53992 RepID=A0AA36M999_CYLNA|nr:unnamed protein product [Cylicocyclus nassatus]
MSSLFVLLLLVASFHQSICLFGIGRRQSVAVRGVLECNGTPAPGVKVKLYEKEIFLDKKLDQTKTDANGSFYLSGSKTEITNIDPKVNIYHKCNYRGPCYKKIAITIPKEYITRGAYPQKTFNVGRLNLAGKLKGESIDCFN